MVFELTLRIVSRPSPLRDVDADRDFVPKERLAGLRRAPAPSDCCVVFLWAVCAIYGEKLGNWL